MTYYVEAYYEDGSPVLGNCDGQGVIRCRNIRRTKHYRHLRKAKAEGRHPRVAYYQIVDDHGRIFETIV